MHCTACATARRERLSVVSNLGKMTLVFTLFRYESDLMSRANAEGHVETCNHSVIKFTTSSSAGKEAEWMVVSPAC